MSNAMALSAVTATVQFWLNNTFNDPSSPLGSVSVTAVAPDIAQASVGKGTNSDLLVNLFLHQVTPNSAWRNAALPRLGSDGSSKLTNQPLALDLHFLLTAYGSLDTEAEALLGYAVLMLHETPVLSRDQIRTALGAVPSTNPYANVLKNSGLADQIEMIKITPATLGREEMAWLWTALKGDYRPTFPFQVSVVLIQPEAPTVFALPVLKRVLTAQSGLQPHLDEIDPPANQAAPGPGDTATALGQTLSAITKISMVNSRLGVTYPPFAPATAGDASLTFVVPNDAPNLPSGVYEVTAQITDGSGNILASSNSVLMGVAPSILAVPAPTAVNNPAGTLVTIHVAPQVLPQQQVSLILGGNSAPAAAFAAKTDTLSFQFPNPPLAPGNYVGRLSVDGIVSTVQVNWAATPPAFVANVVIP
jgi:hypothetical protein